MVSSGIPHQVKISGPSSDNFLLFLSDFVGAAGPQLQSVSVADSCANVLVLETSRTLMLGHSGGGTIYHLLQ
jgi:hypothetical protein